jgi:S1-C subfamily serine protease
MRTVPRLVLLLLSSVVAVSTAPAAAPPLPLPITPDAAQERLQTQLALQQAQSQANFAASQASVQARLDASQARLQAQLAAQEAGTQQQLESAGRAVATAPPLSALLPPVAAGMEETFRPPAGTMQLITLTPKLGHYFGTDHGVLVARAPEHGVLKLQDGDVILAIGERVPASSSQALRILSSYDPGQKIKLLILREHRKIEITASLPLPSGQ